MSKILFPILIICLCLSFCIAGVCCAQESDENGKDHSNWYDNFIFADPSNVFEFIRVIGASTGGGADIGESIDTARRIKQVDDESWYEEWKKTGDRIYDNARKWEEAGHTVSAKEAYLRASNYYRNAGFYMHSPENLPKALKTWKKSVESFKNAIKYMPLVSEVKIPYENTHLPGYFIKSSIESKKSPLLIVHTGFDGTGEELYYIADAASKRGYHTLIFEGPGQGAVIREQGLPFRPDWEKVVTPVVDFAVKQPGVDTENIVLMGISFGGYLAPRAAAFEPRIKICVANGGVFDFSASYLERMPPDFIKLAFDAPDEFNSDIREAMESNTTVRWSFNNGMFVFGVKTPAEVMKKAIEYNLKDSVGKIGCIMLVVDSEGDQFMGNQPRQLFEKLQCPKEMIVFTREETAQAHCQMGASMISNEKIFNKIDEYVFMKK